MMVKTAVVQIYIRTIAIVPIFLLATSYFLKSFVQHCHCIFMELCKSTIFN